MTIGIRVTYIKDGQTHSDEFNSLFQCACHYQIGFECLKKIIRRDPVLSRGSFPTDGVRVELIKRERTKPKKKVPSDQPWTCEICHKTLLLTSKITHLHSKRHLALEHPLNNITIVTRGLLRGKPPLTPIPSPSETPKPPHDEEVGDSPEEEEISDSSEEISDSPEEDDESLQTE